MKIQNCIYKYFIVLLIGVNNVFAGSKIDDPMNQANEMIEHMKFRRAKFFNTDGVYEYMYTDMYKKLGIGIEKPKAVKYFIAMAN